jgi:hypothetical protein
MAWRLCGRSESNFGQTLKLDQLSETNGCPSIFAEVGQKMKRTKHNLHSRTLSLVWSHFQPLLQKDMHDLWLWSPLNEHLIGKQNASVDKAAASLLFDHSSAATRWHLTPYIEIWARSLRDAF